MIGIAAALAVFAYYEVAHGVDYEVVQRFTASSHISPADNAVWCGMDYWSTNCNSIQQIGGTYQTFDEPCSYASISVDYLTTSTITESAGSSSIGLTGFLPMESSRASQSAFLFPGLMTYNHVGLNPGTQFHKELLLTGFPASFITQLSSQPGSSIAFSVAHPTWATNPTNVLTVLTLDCYATKSADSGTVYLTPSDMDDTESILKVIAYAASVMIFLGGVAYFTYLLRR